MGLLKCFKSSKRREETLLDGWMMGLGRRTERQCPDSESTVLLATAEVLTATLNNLTGFGASN